MSNGPNVQGSITIATKSIDDAIKSIDKLERSVRSSSQKMSSGVDRTIQSMGRQNDVTSELVHSVKDLAAAYAKAGGSQPRKPVDNHTSSLVSNLRAINQVEIAQQKLEARIRSSALQEDAKTEELNQSRAAMQRAVASIDQYGNKSAQAATSVGQFRKATTASSIAVQNANRAFRGQAIEQFRTSISNLNSSVQLALGPLSGIASRITALVAVFNRSGVAILALTAAFTAFTVSLSRGMGIAREAETQFLRTESVINSMGATARVTADDLFDMGTDIAQATLLSASEARSAGLALANFSSVATDQFDRVIISAQGMAEQFGGGLVENTRRLGRVMQDPIGRMNDLQRILGKMDSGTKEHIQTLALAGDTYEANEALLGHLSAQYDFATASAGGLDGAIDGVGDMFNHFYEQTLLASGGTEEATKQVNRFKDSLQELFDGPFGQGMGRAYTNSIRVAGNATNFLVDNIDKLIFAFTILAGGAAVRLITTLSKLAFKVLLPFGGGAVKAAAGATSLAGGLNILRTAIGSLTPMMLALRVGVTILGPVLGLLGARLLRNGEDAGEAEDAIALYNAELQETVKTTKALAGYDPEYDRNAEQIIKLAGELDRIQGSLDATADWFERTAKRIEQPLNEIAGQVGLTVDELTESLEDVNFDTLEGMSDELANAFLNVSGSAQESIEAFIRASVVADQLRDRQDDLVETTKELKEEQEESTETLKDFVAELERAEENASRLATEYDRDAESLKKLKNDIDTAKGALETFEEVDVDSEHYDDARKRIEMLKRALVEMNAQVDDLNGEEEFNLGAGFAALVRQADSAKRETVLLTAELKQAQGTMQDIAGMELGNNIAASMQRAEDSIGRLNQGELQALADKMGMDESFNPEKVEEYRAAVAASYNEQLEAEMRRQAFIERNTESQLAANEALQEAEEELAAKKLEAEERLHEALHETSRMKELQAEKDSLMQDAITADASNEDMDAIQEKYDAEVAALEAHAERLTQIRLGASAEEIADLRATRQAELLEMYGEDEEAYEDHLARLKESAENAAVFASFKSGAETAAEGVSEAMQMMEHANAESGDAYKAMAHGQAIIAGALAATKAYAEGGPIAGPAMAALITAKTGAQIAAIEAENFSTGGFVSGKGTGTSDSIPANLSDGEFVMSAAAVKKLGLGSMEQINRGRMPTGLSSGGSVGSSTSSSGDGSGSGVLVQVIDQRSGSEAAPVETEEGFGPDGERRIRIMIRDVVKQQMQNGDYDKQQQERFGNKARPKKR